MVQDNKLFLNYDIAEVRLAARYAPREFGMGVLSVSLLVQVCPPLRYT